MGRLFAACFVVFAFLASADLGNALADTLKIGMVQPLTGAAAESGKYQVQGAKLAVEAVNKAGGVLGKQIELIVEDDQTTNPGAVLAFSKLASDPSIIAFIGSIRSTQVQAMAPDIQKYGRPVMIGGTDPTLTHSGNPWLFRCRPNDSYSARVIADFGLNTLAKKKMGYRSFDGYVWHERDEESRRGLEGRGRGACSDPGVHEQFAGFHTRRTCSPSIRCGCACELYDL